MPEKPRLEPSKNAINAKISVYYKYHCDSCNFRQTDKYKFQTRIQCFPLPPLECKSKDLSPHSLKICLDEMNVDTNLKESTGGEVIRQDWIIQ